MAETSDLHRGRLRNAEDLRRFALAGNATFTVRSGISGERFTLRLGTPRGKAVGPETPLFVSLLTGPDNTSHFSFIGTAWPWKDQWNLRHGRNSKVGPDAPGARAAAWILRGLGGRQPWKLTEQAEFWHEGRCGRCGRALTVPESVERGIGPECAGIIGQ